MSEKSSENSEMSEVMWMSERMRNDIAPNGSVGERILKAARDLKWGYSRTRDYWYADGRIDPKPRELRRVETLTGKQYAPTKELREVDQLIANAEALLEGQDEDFYRAFVAGLRAFIGAVDRPRDS